MNCGLSHIPLLASPPRSASAIARSLKEKEGWLRGQIRSREATLFRADGVVFLFSSIGKPPRLRDDRTLREIFLIARPPLLAVMQGGEYASAYNSFTPAEAGAYIHAFFFFTSRARNACCWRNSFN